MQRYQSIKKMERSSFQRALRIGVNAGVLVCPSQIVLPDDLTEVGQANQINRVL